VDEPAGNYNLIHLKIRGGGPQPAVWCDDLLWTFSCCHCYPFSRESSKMLCKSLYEHLTRNVCVPVLVSVADIIHMSAW